jgi:hypothetical protein
MSSAHACQIRSSEVTFPTPNAAAFSVVVSEHFSSYCYMYITGITTFFAVTLLRSLKKALEGWSILFEAYTPDDITKIGRSQCF